MTWPKRNYQDNHFKQFRSEVLKRDKHTCQMCNCKKRRELQVHHLNRWADSPSLRYETKNGICLCKTCHKSITGFEQCYEAYFFEIIKRNEKRT